MTGEKGLREGAFFFWWLHSQVNGCIVFSMSHFWDKKGKRIRLNPTEDRRVKLTDEQREHMRVLRRTQKLSYNELADHFGVSKRLAIFIINPDKLVEQRKLFKERRADGRYKPTKAAWAATMREHRKYKTQALKKRLGI